MRVRLWLLVMVVVSMFTVPVVQAQGPVVASAQRREVNRVYTLPPEQLRLAQRLFRTRTLLYFVGAGWGILQLLLLLMLRVPGRLRDVVERWSGSRWVQGFGFTGLLLAVILAMNLPLSIYGHHLGLAYGLSVQGWGSWTEELAKEFSIEWVSTALAVMLLFWIIGRSPRRWWAWFWIPAVLSMVFGVLIAPVWIDPLFNRFEPLAAHDPALVERLEQVVARGPLRIPPERMFLMQASTKYTGLNAYVTGIGPSKRVVVWDTSIAKATPDEIAFIFGHEMGHYVMNHIYWTLFEIGLLMLVAFWLGFHMARWALARYGARWGVRSQGDWAALVVYMLVLAVLTFVSEPIINGLSRGHEHDADVYGQEAMHGLMADPQATAAGAFQVLGETSLDDPAPHPWVEFWIETHPSIAERQAFAAGYDPWGRGGHPRYFTH